MQKQILTFLMELILMATGFAGDEGGRVYGGLPFFLEFDAFQSVSWAQPRTKEPLQRKETQTR